MANDPSNYVNISGIHVNGFHEDFPNGRPIYEYNVKDGLYKTYNKNYDISEIEFKFRDRKDENNANRFDNIIKVLKVGLYVTCVGTRFSRWRLVQDINLPYGTFTNQQVNKNFKLMPYASTNGIITIRRIIKVLENGSVLYIYG